MVLKKIHIFINTVSYIYKKYLTPSTNNELSNYFFINIKKENFEITKQQMKRNNKGSLPWHTHARFQLAKSACLLAISTAIVNNGQFAYRKIKRTSKGPVSLFTQDQGSLSHCTIGAPQGESFTNAD